MLVLDLPGTPHGPQNASKTPVNWRFAPETPCWKTTLPSKLSVLGRSMFHFGLGSRCLLCHRLARHASKATLRLTNLPVRTIGTQTCARFGCQAQTNSTIKRRIKTYHSWKERIIERLVTWSTFLWPSGGFQVRSMWSAASCATSRSSRERCRFAGCSPASSRCRRLVMPCGRSVSAVRSASS